MDIAEKLGTLAGVRVAATVPFVNGKVAKFPVEPLSVSSMQTLYTPSATTVPDAFLPFQLP